MRRRRRDLKHLEIKMWNNFWRREGQPGTDLDLSDPPAKKIKLDEAATKEPILVSSLIAKLIDEPVDKEYALFLNAKSPVYKIMAKGGWSKSVGLGKKGRKGK